MKLLINGNPIEFTANQRGNTLEYFLYCREQALASSEFRTTDARGEELVFYVTQNIKTNLCSLMRERRDTKLMLEGLFKAHHPDFVLEMIIGLPDYLELAAWCKHEIHEEKQPAQLSALAKSQQELFQRTNSSDDSRWKPIIKSITDALIKDTQTDETKLARKQIILSALAEAANTPLALTQAFPSLLTTLVHLSPSEQGYLNDKAIKSIFKAHPELYHPSVLSLYFAKLNDYELNRHQRVEGTPCSSESQESLFIIHAMNLIRYSTAENAQRVIGLVNKYLNNQSTVVRQPEIEAPSSLKI